MYWKFIVALFLGLAAALPTNPGTDDGPLLATRDRPQKVRVVHVGLIGTGCPPGSADVTVDATGSLFEASFSAFEVKTGPGTQSSDWRKNCKLIINLEFDAGFQFSILETTTRVFAQIPRGAKGDCDAFFFFTGQNQIKFPHPLLGPINGENRELHANPGIVSFSPCGGSTAILNMNTQCSLRPTHLPALIAVDSISGKLTVKFAVNWQRCRR